MKAFIADHDVYIVLGREAGCHWAWEGQINQLASYRRPSHQVHSTSETTMAENDQRLSSPSKVPAPIAGVRPTSNRSAVCVILNTILQDIKRPLLQPSLSHCSCWLQLHWLQWPNYTLQLYYTWYSTTLIIPQKIIIIMALIKYIGGYSHCL